MNRILLSILSIILFSCEYDPSGSNFLNLTPPDETIPVEIILNDYKPTDTIYIFQNTSIAIKINSTKELKEAQALLDDKLFADLLSNSFNLNLYPDQMDEGVHKLSIHTIFNSGTGSLAEKMGMEGYKGELTWNIRVIKNIETNFKLEYRLNKDRFVEIFWTAPIPYENIEKITINSSTTQNGEITITDFKQNYFTDMGYVCGDANYNLSIHLKGGYTFYKQLHLTSPTPQLHFESIGIDKLRVYWDRPLANGRFKISLGSTILSENNSDTTIYVPQIYGTTRQFYLETRPQNSNFDTSFNRFNSWSNYLLGTSLGLPNWEMYAYNKRDNIIYTTKYSSLLALNASFLDVINTISINGHPFGLIYGGKLATAPHNSTIVAMTGEETWIFSDNRFINPTIIPNLRGDVHTRLSAITSNDRLFIVQSGTNICIVYSIITGSKLFEFTFKYNTIYDLPDFDVVSEDGRYFCASSENGVDILEINGTTTNSLYSDTRSYKGAIFVPGQPDKLILRVGTTIEMRQLPNFNLIQSLNVEKYGAILCNIDPANNSLLYYQNDSLRVCNTDNLSQTIFKIRSDETTCKMYNNKLLTRGKSGIVFDISPYLGLTVK